MASGTIKDVQIVGTYTPSFTWSSGATAPTINIEPSGSKASYVVRDNIMVISMRFHAVSAGGQGDSDQLRISLPSGWTAASAINAPVGLVINSSTTVSPVAAVRVANGMLSLEGTVTGGKFDTHAGTAAASYWGVFAVIPVERA